MDLVWFFIDQFKVPIIGLTLFGLFIWIRVFVRPVRRIMRRDDSTVEKKNSGPRENSSENNEM